MFAPVYPQATDYTTTDTPSGYIIVRHNADYVGVCASPERAQALIATDLEKQRAIYNVTTRRAHDATCF